jgi:hypothetical protein
MEWILFEYFLIRQDKQDYQDIFYLHQFPEEIDETRIHLGGTNILSDQYPGI